MSVLNVRGGNQLDYSGIIRRTKSKRGGIGGGGKKNVHRMKRSVLKKQSNRTKWIESLRSPIRITLHRIYASLGYPPHVSGCTQPRTYYQIWDLDEIRGRHTMGPIPAPLDPREIQLIRRCCHMVKTDKGHVDYRTEEIKRALWESHDLLVNLLPLRSGLNPYDKGDLSKAIKEWAKRVLMDVRYNPKEYQTPQL